jgi:hypothetical protein
VDLVVSRVDAAAAAMCRGFALRPGVFQSPVQLVPRLGPQSQAIGC